MTDDGKAGGGVTRVLVRKNLIVRLAAPRFFRQGDETVLRVIAHNYLETAKDVTFALDVAGLEIIGGQMQKVNIPAKGESFVDWRVKAYTTGHTRRSAARVFHPGATEPAAAKDCVSSARESTADHSLDPAREQ
jgi:uncharacterized protein YfaS (alpha-2-macroglobulin family)